MLDEFFYRVLALLMIMFWILLATWWIWVPILIVIVLIVVFRRPKGKEDINQDSRWE